MYRKIMGICALALGLVTLAVVAQESSTTEVAEPAIPKMMAHAITLEIKAGVLEQHICHGSQETCEALAAELNSRRK